MRLKLDIGGGARRNEWVVIDLDRSLRPDVVADAQFLPFQDTVADELWASHILEHFRQESSIVILQEWNRVLKAEGKITVYVPNALEAFHRWTHGECEYEWLNIVIFGYDPDASPFMAHKCMFWRGSLRNLLNRADFVSLEYLVARGEARGTWEEFGYRGVKSRERTY